MNPELSQLHAIVDGRVQGVGFRMFVLDNASALGLTGWVRNTFSGQVEVLAEGTRPQLEILLADLYRGPRSSWVESIQYEWQQAGGSFNNFSVGRTV